MAAAVCSVRQRHIKLATAAHTRTHTIVVHLPSRIAASDQCTRDQTAETSENEEKETNNQRIRHGLPLETRGVIGRAPPAQLHHDGASRKPPANIDDAFHCDNSIRYDRLFASASRARR